jgi:hypothetical protein
MHVCDDLNIFVMNMTCYDDLNLFFYEHDLFLVTVMHGGCVFEYFCKFDTYKSLLLRVRKMEPMRVIQKKKI